MYKVVLLRHGESLWNKENRFTGWTDVPLSDRGVDEARAAGRQMKADGFVFDIAYTSVLKRAVKTLWLALEEMDQMWIPVENSWRLNERHYGALQGLNKAETAAKHGDEQVLIWRRSYDIPPPALTSDDERHPGRDPRYASLTPDELPLTESLKLTVDRFLPYWHETIAPTIRSGKRVIIAAHGNSLRALVKYLDNISEAEIVGLNIPTGIPLVYELDADLKPIKSYYLGDPEAAKKAAEAVAKQAAAKPGGSGIAKGGAKKAKGRAKKASPAKTSKRPKPAPKKAAKKVARPQRAATKSGHKAAKPARRTKKKR